MSRAIDTYFTANTTALRSTFGVSLDFYPTGAATVEGITGFHKFEVLQVVDGYETTTAGDVETIQVFLSDVGLNRTGYFVTADSSKYDIVTVFDKDENQIKFEVKKR